MGTIRVSYRALVGTYMKYILVVDDELDILDAIVDTLEIEFDSDEITVERAMNGVEALNLFKENQNKYELVVTDINMPEMDGLELTENIKSLNSKIPVIVFTGHGDLEEQEKLNNLGVKAMVKKPYVEDLIDQVTVSLSA